MSLRSVAVHLLSATYWRYRRQNESHETSAFWVKAVFGLHGAMWGLVAYRLLFHAVAALQPVQVRTHAAVTALVLLFYLVAGYGVHRFMRANPVVYIDHLPPEEHFQGNVYLALFTALSGGGICAILMTLGKV